MQLDVTNQFNPIAQAQEQDALSDDDFESDEELEDADDNANTTGRAAKKRKAGDE
jgi:hypothetical protein